jgi:hypothetical protein
VKKIPTMFERDWDGDRSRVIDKPHPDCGWVFAGEGIATRKYDGTSCLLRDGKIYKRREIKQGAFVPPDFEAVTYDEETGKTVGWVPVGDGPDDRWHREAFEDARGYSDGTFELLGPKVQGNVEWRSKHVLQPHSMARTYPLAPRTFEGLRAWFEEHRDIEGLVFHHEDGRMAKIKLRDFGIKRTALNDGLPAADRDK